MPAWQQRVWARLQAWSCRRQGTYRLTGASNDNFTLVQPKPPLALPAPACFPTTHRSPQQKPACWLAPCCTQIRARCIHLPPHRDRYRANDYAVEESDLRRSLILTTRNAQFRAEAAFAWALSGVIGVVNGLVGGELAGAVRDGVERQVGEREAQKRRASWAWS